MNGKSEMTALNLKYTKEFKELLDLKATRMGSTITKYIMDLVISDDRESLKEEIIKQKHILKSSTLRPMGSSKAVQEEAEYRRNYQPKGFSISH